MIKLFMEISVEAKWLKSLEKAVPLIQGSLDQ